MSFSRHTLSGRTEERNVPPTLIDGLTRMYGQYDFGGHSKPDSANAELLAGHPEEESYLMQRFALVGTPEEGSERVAELIAEIGDVGIFLGTAVPDPERHVRLVGERFRPRLLKLVGPMQKRRG